MEACCFEHRGGREQFADPETLLEPYYFGKVLAVELATTKKSKFSITKTYFGS